MTDKELVHRALMGDEQAQQECTEKGIVLPCPFCGGEAIIEFDSVAPFEYDVVCGDCGVARGISEDKQVVLREWNTRPAPPVGKCKDCVWSREPTKENYAEIGRDVLAYKDSLMCGFCEDARWKDDFCSYFKKKEEKNNENN